MLELAVVTDAETRARMTDPLAARGITVRYVEPDGRTFDFSPVADVDVGFVFPQRLMEGGVLDALLDVPWVNDRDAVLRSRNKAGVFATLSTHDVPFPETRYVSNPVSPAALNAVYDAFDGPVVVKPNSTTRGAGVTLVHDRDAFLGVADYFELLHADPTTADKSFLVQEFIADARDYRVTLIDGDVVGAVERLGEGWKHNVHAGATPRQIECPDRVRELAETTAAILDIPWLGVDVLATDDRVVVTETNARPTIDADNYDDDFFDRLAALIERTAEN